MVESSVSLMIEWPCFFCERRRDEAPVRVTCEEYHNIHIAVLPRTVNDMGITLRLNGFDLNTVHFIVRFCIFICYESHDIQGSLLSVFEIAVQISIIIFVGANHYKFKIVTNETIRKEILR